MKTTSSARNRRSIRRLLSGGIALGLAVAMAAPTSADQPPSEISGSCSVTRNGHKYTATLTMRKDPNDNPHYYYLFYYRFSGQGLRNRNNLTLWQSISPPPCVGGVGLLPIVSSPDNLPGNTHVWNPPWITRPTHNIDISENHNNLYCGNPQSDRLRFEAVFDLEGDDPVCLGWVIQPTGCG